MAIAASVPHRAVVEHMVRQAVYSRLGKPLPRAASAPNPLVVNISARHCHLTPEASKLSLAKASAPFTSGFIRKGSLRRKPWTLIGPRSLVISICASSVRAGIRQS
jgi:putative phosphotransacetylase